MGYEIVPVLVNTIFWGVVGIVLPFFMPKGPEKGPMEYGDGGQSSRSALGKVFMQLMCPSCCGGLFSETKGSVYTKRRNISHESVTKSETTTIGNETYDGENTEVQYEPGTRVTLSASIKTRMRQIATDNAIVEEVTEADDFASVSNHTNVLSHRDTLKENVDVTLKENDLQPRAGSKITNRPKLVRDITIREELDMLSKPGTSLPVEEEIEEKLENCKWSKKLRKTNYSDRETNGTVSQDTVIELKIRGQEHNIELKKQNGDNKPSFDFQAVLRKTNSTRQSLRRFSNINDDNADGASFIILELLPGVILQGSAYDV